MGIMTTVQIQKKSISIQISQWFHQLLCFHTNILATEPCFMIHHHDYMLVRYFSQYSSFITCHTPGLYKTCCLLHRCQHRKSLYHIGPIFSQNCWDIQTSHTLWSELTVHIAEIYMVNTCNLGSTWKPNRKNTIEYIVKTFFANFKNKNVPNEA